MFLHKARTFESLYNATFRIYYIGMIGQWLSMGMQQVTQSFLVYYLTGSAAILGTASLATGLPSLILLLFGGAFADRFQKKRMLQLSQLGECCSALIIFIALLTGYISKDHTGSWWIIIMTSTFSGIFNGLAMPARQAMIVEIVDREHIMNATSLSSMGQNICSLAGPSVAGFLIGSRMDYKVVYATMVGLYLMAIILTNFLPAISAVPTRSRNTFNDIKEGLKYVRSNSLILMIIIFNLCCILMAAPRIQLMPIFATDILKVGAAGQGVLQSVGAAGSLIASAIYASLPSKKRGLLMLLAGLSLGLTLTVFAFSTSYPLSIAMMLLVGIGQTGHMVMGNIFLQTLSDKEYVGRVMSVLMMCMSLSNLMIFFVGIYTEFVGARWAIGSLSMALVLIASASLIFLPRIRKLD